MEYFDVFIDFYHGTSKASLTMFVEARSKVDAKEAVTDMINTWGASPKHFDIVLRKRNNRASPN